MAAVVRILRRLRRSDDGASLIELAIVLPLLAILVVGIIETGRWLTFGIQLSNAAHAGAQFAAQSEINAYQSTDVAAAACNDSQFSCTTSTPAPGNTAAPNTMFVTSSVSCTYSNGTTSTSCPTPSSSAVQRNMYVQVSTAGTFKPLMNLPLMPNSVPMSASAIVQVGQ